MNRSKPVRMNARLLLVLTLGASAGVSHALTPTEASISRSDMAAQWPLTVESGTIGCERGKALKFSAAGKTYALTGWSQSYSKQMGFGWLPVAAIWRDSTEIPGTKVPLTGLIAKGQALCKPWP